MERGKEPTEWCGEGDREGWGGVVHTVAKIPEMVRDGQDVITRFGYSSGG